MLNPQVNETWKTKSGRTVLIVKVISESATESPVESLGFMWWDEVDREFLVSPLMGRLRERVSQTPQEFFKEMAANIVLLKG